LLKIIKRKEIKMAIRYNLKKDIEYSDGSIVSKEIYKNKSTITLFAFDKGQSLSSHKAPFDAGVLILDGKGEFVIGNEKITAESGDFFVMPANVMHAVNAIERFKMMLTMLAV
jgi:quercetin dioxygenase-like cupin family protein